MTYYETVSEAMQALFLKGYTTDFSLLTEKDCLYCYDRNHSLNTDEFVIDEIHRFEGDTDPGDEMILYAISSPKHALKGLLLNAFGMYSDAANSKIVEKLKYQEKNHVPPQKRAPELIPLSREHHHGLLLCWKIKTGLSKKIETGRINKYIDWYYKTHLLPHFETEEKHLFTLLSETNTNRIKAQDQHVEIKKIIEKGRLNDADLIKLESLLHDHIRFEERVLFNEIQQFANLKEIGVLLENRPEKFCDYVEDPFWK